MSINGILPDPALVTPEQAAQFIYAINRGLWELSVRGERLETRPKTFADVISSLGASSNQAMPTDSFKNSQFPFLMYDIGVTVLDNSPVLSDLGLKIAVLDGDYIIGAVNAVPASCLVPFAGTSDNSGLYRLRRPLRIGPNSGFRVECFNLDAGATHTIRVALVGDQIIKE